jgi:hypothetical protein
MSKYLDFTVLVIFVTKWATPVLGCDSNSGCGDEAIRLVFAIIGGIILISIIMVVVYFCCLKSSGKQREIRGNVHGQCLCNRWNFSGGVYAEEGFTQTDRYGGSDFGHCGYARREFTGGRYDRSDFGEGGYARGEFADARDDGGDFSGYAGGTLLTAHAVEESLIKVVTPGSNFGDGTVPLITI